MIEKLRENPLTDPNPTLEDAGTPIYDALRAKSALEDEFFTLLDTQKAKIV
jgi:hypothetical protein